ncbi:hypothetical protein GCM10009555_018100 [Acrocarpospora macrocephala]|uniref:Uncharacterized protein n=1 Tax=Acrocarpospora macrocephala TaxID=150177 RepID=A0A5M3WGQ2_9ACTN|nr:hypothetical protein [Acrocarpospora macrocephala]GES07470.1 hypothetical protein Amac_010650 [Acrocarpospora macrocephala]
MSVIGQEEGIKHGTRAGYKQHLYRKVDACEACLEAERGGPRKQAPASSKPALTKPARPNPDAGLPGGVTREAALTYIPYADAQGHAIARRERIKAAAAAILLGAPDVIEALGVPDDEVALARQFADRLTQQSEAA